MCDRLADFGVSADAKGISIQRQGRVFRMSLPEFPLQGGAAEPCGSPEISVTPWKDGTEALLTYPLTVGAASLQIVLRVREQAPFLRLRYRLCGNVAFDGRDGENPISYGEVFADYQACTEWQLSHFNRILHSFQPLKLRYCKEELHGRDLTGPVVILNGNSGSVLFAYEHGAEMPDHYLAFRVTETGVQLHSVKGNYYGGQPVEEYLSPWLQVGFGATEQDLLRDYRRFFLEDVCVSAESRKPYLFYNTWNYQERRKYLEHQPYLSDMNEERMLAEIDVAHRMGLEVFVIDTGWYEKTGDWSPDPHRFPGGLKNVREKLESYGMRFGLWLNPIAAAVSSQIYREHPEYVFKHGEEPGNLGPIWETEESYGMCFASGYSDWLIEKIVELNRTLGVTYFKWDAIGQYECDAPGHLHGTEANTPEERREVFSYRMGLEMTRVAEEVSQRCPGVIVDFDVTEGGRYVGLGFLSAGKYFSINNGPYFNSFDIPNTVKMEPDTINVFFYPGAARPQVCRASAEFDGVIPSILFLTHYLPEGDDTARENSAAALALGGNGIWGDLLALKEEEIDFWKRFTDEYKKVRDDVTVAYPRVMGMVGSSPEIHEKLNMQNGKGLVAVFTHSAGEFVHITQPLPSKPSVVVGADEYEMLPDNRLKLTLRMERDGARTVFVY
jgi:alpha-galactosidase